jgi:superfamily I DNA/RNA helicase
MTEFIDGLFDDSDVKKCIRLSSIHRSKGLEASKVFFYNPGNVPHPMAKTEEAKIQEMNLKFVATTRAINELIYVNAKKTVSSKPAATATTKPKRKNGKSSLVSRMLEAELEVLELEGEQV